MQHTQQNYRAAVLCGALAVALLFGVKAAYSAGIADRGKPDPILSAPVDGPCTASLDQPDLTPGTDVEGHQVASADIQNAPVPLPGQVAIPLRQGRGRAPAYVMADGKKLDPLLNPKPACR